jgi:hypothetical protein
MQKTVEYDQDAVQKIADKFSKDSIIAMVQNLRAMGLVDREQLIRSIKYSLKFEYDELSRIQFSYAWYGKFFQSGANNVFGKGIELPATHWRSLAIDQFAAQLGEELSQYYANLIINNIQIEDVKA